MKRTSFLFAHRFIILSSIIISILFVPVFTDADTGTFYRCVDKQGNETLSDHIIGGYTCKPMGDFEKMSDEESENYKIDRDLQSTKTYNEIQVAERKAEEAREKAREAAERAAQAERISELEKKTAANEKAIKEAAAAARDAQEAAVVAMQRAWKAQREAEELRNRASQPWRLKPYRP